MTVTYISSLKPSSLLLVISSVQFSSVAQSCPTVCDPMNRSTPGLPVHHQLPEFTQTHVYRVGDAIQPSHLLSSPSPAPNPSHHQGLFQWVSSLHEVAKVLEFQLSIIPSNEYPGLVSFRMDWLDLLAVQGTLKSLLQHHSSKASLVLSFLHSPTLTSIHWSSPSSKASSSQPPQESMHSSSCLSPPSFLSRAHFTHMCAQLLQLCLTLCDPMDCSPQGSSVCGIL